jgi:hypothetical protein
MVTGTKLPFGGHSDAGDADSVIAGGFVQESGNVSNTPAAPFTGEPQGWVIAHSEVMMSALPSPFKSTAFAEFEVSDPPEP